MSPRDQTPTQLQSEEPLYRYVPGGPGGPLIDEVYCAEHWREMTSGAPYRRVSDYELGSNADAVVMGADVFADGTCLLVSDADEHLPVLIGSTDVVRAGGTPWNGQRYARIGLNVDKGRGPEMIWLGIHENQLGRLRAALDQIEKRFGFGQIEAPTSSN
ncbi:hypothetical protein [Nakamurella multipartita]|uniref:Uncharacterized protein n=1 Tax=Nakamurella multipartita (strain ATCC 700099 / DSM 44233 / CIP 104796 / JCM 9543 / NBRC 105858 / Y-104) TaxID=479431 RepID=C8X9S0_NAKMY|nr:hypothetical protein [Nakamurella multipartita]ACV79228.1 hypothetical protein Namu_2888 [Nakamurella multipartita DSM 44233]